MSVPWMGGSHERMAKVRLTFEYIRRELLTAELWSDLHTNAAADHLRRAVRNHFADVMWHPGCAAVVAGFQPTEELLAKLRGARKC